MRTAILHYHIFKNAGTSFNEALHQAFPGKVHEFDGDTSASRLPPPFIGEIIATNADQIAFSTHQGMLPPPEVDGVNVFSTILLRHPLARLPSIYQFERRQDVQSPGAIHAKKYSFGDYLRWRWEQSPSFFCFQARFCASCAGYNYLQSPEMMLVEAKANLSKLDCVGTVESYSTFLRNCEQKLNPLMGQIRLNALHSNTSNTSRPTHEAMCQRLLAETDAAFMDQILPLIGLDEELWTHFDPASAMADGSGVRGVLRGGAHARTSEK